MTKKENVMQQYTICRACRRLAWCVYVWRWWLCAACVSA
jgi:hypothetical protein